ncbi:MAG: hypothetical protein ACE3JQ_01470 [Paenisporosarcina sp.]
MIAGDEMMITEDFQGTQGIQGIQGILIILITLFILFILIIRDMVMDTLGTVINNI